LRWVSSRSLPRKRRSVSRMLAAMSYSRLPSLYPARKSASTYGGQTPA
jgi:hypothetical protein